MFGWIGKGLKVDLTAGEVRVFKIEKSLFKKFLGGRGLASYFLFRELPEKVDPFSPENIVIFSAGPLAGTSWPTSSRINVTAKSPLTTGLGYATAGGDLGPELKFAGYDLLLISGKAKVPIYLYIENENYSLKDASHIWKQGTSGVIKVIREEVGNCRIACIGPAGTNLVRISSIITDKERAAARCGIGAVMGSKNLKAVAIKGNNKIKSADPVEFQKLCKESHSRWSPKNPQLEGLSRYGTPHLIAAKNEMGDLPGKNHQEARFPWTEEISGETIREKYFLKFESCFGCRIHCKAYLNVLDGKYAPITGLRPEYESIDALGPMCWVSDFSAIMKANTLCNELGLDTISTGVVIAFAMELWEKGIISKKDTGGLDLSWGNTETVLQLINMISYREGFGDTLAEGVARAAERIGTQARKYAMHVKKMEMPRQEPRTLKAFALGHAVSNRGADHLYALPTIDSGKWDVAKQLFPEKPLDKLMDLQNPTCKPEIVVFSENYCAVTDALGICKFTTTQTYVFMPSDLANALSALTGKKFAENELLTCGERIVNLERLFNVREGFSQKDDNLPRRFLKEPCLGNIVELDRMLSKYYNLRGWSETGIPNAETLRKLGLDRT